jgi:hypothetical protein
MLLKSLNLDRDLEVRHHDGNAFSMLKNECHFENSREMNSDKLSTTSDKLTFLYGFVFGAVW